MVELGPELNIHYCKENRRVVVIGNGDADTFFWFQEAYRWLGQLHINRTWESQVTCR